MFRPKGSNTLQGRTNLLGDRDRKTLRQTFVSQYPKHGLDCFNSLVPVGVPLESFAPKGSQVEIFLSGGVPVFFTISKKRNALLFPVLTTLWTYPDMLPSIVTQQRTPPYLIRGADLMLPGCLPPEEGYASMGMDRNQVWSVRVPGNKCPYALGTILMSTEELETAERGKLLEVQHVVGDLLLKMHPNPVLPEGITVESCAAVDADSEDVDAHYGDSQADTKEDDKTVKSEATVTENKVADLIVDDNADEGGSDESASSDAGDENPQQGDDVPAAVYEAIIELCLYDVIRKTLPESLLPVDISAVWGRVLQIIGNALTQAPDNVLAWLKRRGAVSTSAEELPPNAKDLKQIDLRRTSWKNIKKMGNHFKKTKIWTIKELRGQTTILKINRAHPLILGHVLLPDSVLTATEAPLSKYGPGTAGKSSSKSQAASQATPTSNPSGSIVAVSAWQPTALSRELLVYGGLPASSGRAFKESDVRGALGLVISKLASQPADAGDLFPPLSMDNAEIAPLSEPKEGAKLQDPETIDWSDFLTRESRLVNLCLLKSERQIVKTSGECPKVNNDEVLARFLSNGMKPVTLLLKAGTDVIAALAHPDDFGVIEADAKITVSTHKTKRFTRTRVSGIHDFPMIDPKQLAEKLQKACAAAASVCELDEVKGKVKPLGVVVQGVFVREVCQVLETTYGLPNSMIHTRV